MFTDLHLKGERLLCDRAHQHRRLVGWSRVHRKPWTRVAQEYPRRFCAWLSSAILYDAGLLPGRKRVSPLTMANQTSARIGEAQNPGPKRPGPRQRRQVQTLLDVSELGGTWNRIVGRVKLGESASLVFALNGRKLF